MPPLTLAQAPEPLLVRHAHRRLHDRCSWSMGRCDCTGACAACTACRIWAAVSVGDPCYLMDSLTATMETKFGYDTFFVALGAEQSTMFEAKVGV